jgi:hypothetical protein
MAVFLKALLSKIDWFVRVGQFFTTVRCTAATGVTTGYHMAKAITQLKTVKWSVGTGITISMSTIEANLSALLRSKWLANKNLRK